MLIDKKSLLSGDNNIGEKREDVHKAQASAQ
jgi:hypothetical protein